MAGLPSSTARAVLRAVVVMPLCAAGVLFLLISSAAYNQDYFHVEDGCLSEKEFLAILPPHERALFHLVGGDGVAWAYDAASLALVAAGVYICIPRKRAASSGGPTRNDRRPGRSFPRRISKRPPPPPDAANTDPQKTHEKPFKRYTRR